jgi:hypothetical protein
MPFRETFQCLWCGRAHRARTTLDLEGWALLCPACLGRAGENEFIRFRLKRALAERSRAGQPPRPTAESPLTEGRPTGPSGLPFEPSTGADDSGDPDSG